jgi:hypothetical protein
MEECKVSISFFFSGVEAAHEKLSAVKEISSFDASTGMLETDYKTHFEECRKRVRLRQCLDIFLYLFSNVLYSLQVMQC